MNVRKMSLSSDMLSDESVTAGSVSVCELNTSLESFLLICIIMKHVNIISYIGLAILGLLWLTE